MVLHSKTAGHHNKGGHSDSDPLARSKSLEDLIQPGCLGQMARASESDGNKYCTFGCQAFPASSSHVKRSELLAYQ